VSGGGHAAMDGWQEGGGICFGVWMVACLSFSPFFPFSFCPFLGFGVLIGMIS
jgi:hypothetical protein